MLRSDITSIGNKYFLGCPAQRVQSTPGQAMAEQDKCKHETDRKAKPGQAIMYKTSNHTEETFLENDKFDKEEQVKQRQYRRCTSHCPKQIKDEQYQKLA